MTTALLILIVILLIADIAETSQLIKELKDIKHYTINIEEGLDRLEDDITADSTLHTEHLDKVHNSLMKNINEEGKRATGTLKSRAKKKK